ncbi:CCA tRNA nucleotidyltransferase [bacterium]|nr:CCA tRNA nucleotidyltransferase [bacterium]
MKELDLVTKIVLEEVEKIAREHDMKAYLVGGFVRDWLLERETKDIDLATDGDPLLLANDIASQLGGKIIVMNGYRVIRCLLPGRIQVDVSSLTGTVEEDMARRDFTANALAVPLDDLNTLIDPFNGKKDIEEKVLRMVSEEAFVEDPLRMLRAIRLAAVLGFTIEEQTKEAIRKHAPLITQAPPERVKEELFLLSRVTPCYSYILLMEELGLLMGILPELSALKGVMQDGDDVFEHSVNTLKEVENLLAEGFADIKLDSKDAFILKLGALIHDVGKFATRRTEPDGTVRFIGHDVLGESMMREIGRRLRLSKKDVKTLRRLVRHHLRPAFLSHFGELSHRVVFRFFQDLKEDAILLLLLSYADRLATKKVSEEELEKHKQLTLKLIEEAKKESRRPRRLLSGRDIVQEFGQLPGPTIGRLLRLSEEAYAEGLISTKEEALDFVRRLLDEES